MICLAAASGVGGVGTRLLQHAPGAAAHIPVLAASAAKRLLPQLMPKFLPAASPTGRAAAALRHLVAPYTSMPEPAVSAETPAATAAAGQLPTGFQVAAPGSPHPITFLQLPTRPYGPAATLSAAATDAGVLEFTHPAWLQQGAFQLAAQQGTGLLSPTVALLRQPFLPAGARPTPLTQMLAPLGPAGSGVALSSPFTRPTAATPLVDLYTTHHNHTLAPYPWSTTSSTAATAAAGGSTPLLPSQYRLAAAGLPLPAALSRLGLAVAVVPDAQAAAGPAGANLNSVKAALSGGALRQSTNRVLMVSPTAFGFNPQAAADNAYMSPDQLAAAGSTLTAQVLAEFQGLHTALTAAGVGVEVWEHPLGAATPDAVFPNNWFSTHRAGDGGGGCTSSSLVLYPMRCPNRAAERREDILKVLQGRGYQRLVDLTWGEAQGLAFEGTGVLSLDRIHGIAYVNISDRAAAPLAASWVEEMGYQELVAFRAVDAAGAPMYHTNVMMSVGSDVAIVCPEAVPDEAERRHLLGRLADTGHTLVTISQAQVGQLCGNVLQLLNGDGLPVLAMSSRAHRAFTRQQLDTLGRHVAGVVHAPIDTLERVGGGGVRCCMAELWEP